MSAAAASAGAPGSFWRPALAGAAGSLVSIGLARFAYTPLIPAVIAAGWFSPSQAAYLGAINLIGYLIGAIGARGVARRVPIRLALRVAILLATIAMLACAEPVSFLWFAVWRVIAGLAGGIIMVLAAPAVLALVPAGRRGLAGGVVFTGVGLGIALSGVLVPPLLRLGLPATWLGLGGLSAVLTAATWTSWPSAAPAAARQRTRFGGAVLAVIVEYGLNAFGVVPHMIFLVDFVARYLGRGMAAGAVCWIAFGAGRDGRAGLCRRAGGPHRLSPRAAAGAAGRGDRGRGAAAVHRHADAAGLGGGGRAPSRRGWCRWCSAASTPSCRPAATPPAPPGAGRRSPGRSGRRRGRRHWPSCSPAPTSYTPLFAAGAAALLLALLLDLGTGRARPD